jgi:O-antigen ligase
LLLNKVWLIRVSLFLVFIDAFDFGYWPTESDINTESNVIGKSITLISLIAMLLTCLVFYKSIIKTIFTRSLMYINIILACAAMSSFFADNIMYSMTITLRLSLFYCFIIGVLNFKSSVLWESLYKFIPFFIVTNLLVIIFIPSLGIGTDIREGTWRGLLPFKTQFGLCCVFLATFLYGYSKSYLGKINKKDFLCILLLTLMCFGSQSFVALGIYFLYFWIKELSHYYRNTGYMFKAIIIILLIVFVSISGVTFQYFSEEIFMEMGKSDSIYSRFKMWELILDGYIESPLLGYGLGRYLYSPGVLDNIQQTIWFFKTSTMHNSYLEWALGAGTIAAVCYIVIHLRVLRVSLTNLRQENMIPNILLGPILVGSIGAFVTSSIAFSNLFWLAPITLSYFYKVKNNV